LAARNGHAMSLDPKQSLIIWYFAFRYALNKKFASAVIDLEIC